MAESLISDLVSKGVERIASGKSLTSQDLTVLLLHEQSRRMSGIEQKMEGVEKTMVSMEKTLEGLGSDLVPLLNQARDIADIRARLERIEAKVS